MPTSQTVNIDNEYVIEVLGCDLFEVRSKEDKLEEFIVLKAILDKNLPKMVQSDTQVFKNILMDVFPSTPFPKSALSQIKEVTKATLASHHLHDGEDLV